MPNGFQLSAVTGALAPSGTLVRLERAQRVDATLDDLVRAKGPTRLPVVLTRDEVRAILSRIHGAPRLMTTLLYGSGLRLQQSA